MTDPQIHLAEWLTSANTAARIRARGLRCSNATLDNHASRGAGPIFRLVRGRRYYLATDVDDWIDAQIGQPVRRASDARLAREVAA